MSLSARHIAMAAALVAAAACAAPASAARASAVCGQGTYAYAGYDGRAAMAGVSATIEQAGPLAVHAGHVAGWIGVVDPRTSRAWLQVGLSAMPGQTTSAVYYEFSAPGGTPVYRQLQDGIAAGEPHSFAVVEQPWNPGWWVVWVDGRMAGAPLHLPGSHHRWTAQVLGESWAGSRSGACNAYSYAFDSVRLLRASGRLTPISGGLSADPNYVVADRTHSGFVAASFGLGGFRNAQVQTPASKPAGGTVPPQHAHTQQTASGAASRPPRSGLTANCGFYALQKPSLMPSFESLFFLAFVLADVLATSMSWPLKQAITSFSFGLNEPPAHAPGLAPFFSSAPTACESTSSVRPWKHSATTQPHERHPTYAGQYTWAHATSLNDVTSGSNSHHCSPSAWCTAGSGWDGPTGLGTPNGIGAF